MRENQVLVLPVPASEKGLKSQFAPFQVKWTHETITLKTDFTAALVWGFINAYELLSMGKTGKTGYKYLEKQLLYFSGMQESYLCPNFASKASISTIIIFFLPFSTSFS